MQFNIYPTIVKVQWIQYFEYDKITCTRLAVIYLNLNRSIHFHLILIGVT